jgi:hypothetical protein
MEFVSTTLIKITRFRRFNLIHETQFKTWRESSIINVRLFVGFSYFSMDEDDENFSTEKSKVGTMVEDCH